MTALNINKENLSMSENILAAPPYSSNDIAHFAILFEAYVLKMKSIPAIPWKVHLEVVKSLAKLGYGTILSRAIF